MKSNPLNTIELFRTVSLAALLAMSGSAGAQVASPKTMELAPHRAVYDLSLDQSGAGSNVTDIRGKLIYDFTGSACAGYTLNTRLLTQIFDREGKPSVTDIRSESFEQAGGERFTFNTSQYLNNQLSEATKGIALRKSSNKGALLVELEKPKKGTVKLASNVVFPTQHSLEILKAAQLGESRLQANLYDGSEKGVKIYETSTVIGSPLSRDENAKLPAVKNSNALNDLRAWPIVISYYDAKQSKDGLPTYEVSFRMYENGVSRKLRLDYGTFSLAGELASIEFLTPKSCGRSRSASTPKQRG